MGRRKGQINQMGNSLLVKDRRRKHGHRGNSDNFVHTTELDDGVSYNRINFQSVTEQSNLEDFLNTAEMAGRDFAAERQNISIISNAGEGVRLTDGDLDKISTAQKQFQELLRIPRRPPWNEFTTKEELLLMERDSFTSWRRELKILEEKDHIQLTPYEKNLDFWRQLWRVIERSDVIVQIVDARNPLLFRCPDLDTYAKEVDKDKTVLLLVNKADYLSYQQRLQWIEYFDSSGIKAVFFSAKAENEKHEAENDELPEVTEEDEEETSEDSEEEEEDSGSEEDDKDNSSEEDDKDNGSDKEKGSEHHASDKVSNEQLLDAALERLQLKDNENNNAENLDESENSMARIVSAEELLSVFRSLANTTLVERSGGVATVGMVGYPNVGKSSTINSIIQHKKLAVSATPGRTKHFQTIFVDDSLMLCDCPGLVFPSFVTTKAHLVINGILPIDELRDHVSPINLICDHIPRNVLEATYSILIPRPSVDDDQDRIPTAEELLNAYGGMRGFMTTRGIPDGPRASRYLLKDFVRGKLLFCNPPPGIDAAEFQDKQRVIELEAARPCIKAPLPQIKSTVDKEFFDKRQSGINSKGVHQGVKGFLRVDCLKTTSKTLVDAYGNSVDGSVAGSCSSLNSVGQHNKPWKKHNNRNKKEKLRRLHKDLDVH